MGNRVWEGEEMTKGIIIIAMGGIGYIREAKANLRACFKLSNLPVTVFTDQPKMFEGKKSIMTDMENMKANPPGTLQVVDASPVFGFKNQTRYVPLTPYDWTVHLDCDAIPIHPTAFQPFVMLNQFDFVAAHAAARGFKIYRKAVPPCFPQFNCGVMFYGPRSIPLLKRWDNQFKPGHARTNPQQSLAGLLYRSKLRLGVLPPEWNWRGHIAFNDASHCRIAHAHFVPGMVKADGKIDRVRFQKWFMKSIHKKAKHDEKKS